MTTAHVIPTSRGLLGSFARWLQLFLLRWRLSDVESAIDLAEDDRDEHDVRMLKRYRDHLTREIRAIENT